MSAPAIATGRQGSPPRRIRRPPWWAVLAIALALMALVAATSAGRAPAARVAGPSVGTTTTVPPVGGADGPATDTTTTSAVVAPTSTDPTVVPPISGTDRPAVTGAPGSTAPDGHPPTSVPGTATSENDSTTETPTDGTSVGTVAGVAASTSTTVGVPPGPVQMQPGNLEAPDNVSATYPVTTSPGVLSAEVTWQGDSPLTLTLWCPDGSRSVAGAATLDASLTTSGGACAVSLAEDPGAAAAVGYLLQIRPAA